MQLMPSSTVTLLGALAIIGVAIAVLVIAYALSCEPATRKRSDRYAKLTIDSLGGYLYITAVCSKSGYANFTWSGRPTESLALLNALEAGDDYGLWKFYTSQHPSNTYPQELEMTEWFDGKRLSEGPILTKDQFDQLIEALKAHI